MAVTQAVRRILAKKQAGTFFHDEPDAVVIPLPPPVACTDLVRQSDLVLRPLRIPADEARLAPPKPLPEASQTLLANLRKAGT